VQVKTGVFNIFYPSDEEPLSHLRARLPSFPPDAVCPAWEPWNYATLEFAIDDSESAAALLEELFLHFYDFPADTDVESEVLDMRGGGEQP
jgi:hypothetical protein